MQKRGQLTIFIIVAIIILAIAMLIFLFVKLPSGTGGINSDAINNFVSECIEETSENAIYKIGQNGGYYFPPITSTPSGIPYYYLNGKRVMLSKARLENEISLFIEENIFFCTKNFVVFDNYNITQGEIKVETTILKDEVRLKIEYPIRISQGEDVSQIKNFEEEIPVRLGLIYDSIYEALNLSKDGICMSCLYNLALKNDFYVEMLDYEEKTVIIIFRDKNSQIKKEDYEYVYAIQI